MTTSKPVRQLTDNTKIFAYAGQLFCKSHQAGAAKVIRILEAMGKRKQEEMEHEETER